MRVFLLISFLSLFSSCAKLGYVWDQGLGQLRLMNRARFNEKVLKDPKIAKEFKEKIKTIEKAKDYFFSYFKEKPRKIYRKTVILEGKAVSYLVISSPKDQIKAETVSFGPFGTYPYLGFFSVEKAKAFQKSQEQKGLATYLRPVLAYSTLGYLEDSILSSFFHMSEISMVEMIFHELFHTVFFIKDEVDLSESLAVLMSQKLMEQYLDSIQRDRYLEELREQKLISYNLVMMTQKLNESYAEKKQGPDDILHSFMSSVFYPHFKKVCQEEKIKESSCWPLQNEFNNARLAAYLTYEGNSDFLRTLYEKKSHGPFEFLALLKKLKADYDEKDLDISFKEFLKEQ